MLEELIQELYASGIHIIVQTSSAGLMLLITDRYNRIRAEHLVSASVQWERDVAAQWLHRHALYLFPESKYARERRQSFTTFMLKDSQNLNFAIAAEEYAK